MGKILLLEDNDSMRRHTSDLLSTSEYLTGKGYEVHAFRRIDQAKYFFNKEKDSINCIVADLNMSDEWLGEYRNESFGCRLSGWVWLNRFVFPEKPDIPTVIYSGFIEELKANIPADQLERKNINIIDKGADDDEGFSGLIEAIQKVTQKRS